MYRLHHLLMSLSHLLTVSVIIVGLLQLAASADSSAADPTVPDKDKRYLFSVTLHTQDEIDSMLSRAETLSKTFTTKPKVHAGIALVLHGPEIEMFTRKNYNRYQPLIDKAARLDSSSVIEIKVCRTAMDDMNIREEDLPAFVEIVPYGPDEEKRLERQGYIYF